MTLDPNKLSQIRTIITHANCPDGLLSALLAKHALECGKLRPSPTVEIKFMQYQTEELRDLPATPGMLFTDFSPPVERAQEFIDAGAIVLDHHKTARSIVEAFGENGIFGDEIKEPGVCGATLVYRHVWLALENYSSLPLHEAIARMVRLAGVRDTWQRQSPEWRDACKQAEVLLFMPKERWLMMPLPKIVSQWDEHFDWIGEVELEKHGNSVRKAADEVLRFTSGKGTKVAIISNGLHTVSDAADLLEDNDLIIAFSYKNREGVPTLILSNRARGAYDCSKFAKFYGGGGHTKAAGFSVPVKETDMNPYVQVRKMVEDFEAS